MNFGGKNSRNVLMKLWPFNPFKPTKPRKTFVFGYLFGEIQIIILQYFYLGGCHRSIHKPIKVFTSYSGALVTKNFSEHIFFLGKFLGTNLVIDVFFFFLWIMQFFWWIILAWVGVHWAWLNTLSPFRSFEHQILKASLCSSHLYALHLLWCFLCVCARHTCACIMVIKLTRSLVLKLCFSPFMLVIRLNSWPLWLAVISNLDVLKLYCGLTIFAE